MSGTLKRVDNGATVGSQDTSTMVKGPDGAWRRVPNGSPAAEQANANGTSAQVSDVVGADRNGGVSNVPGDPAAAYQAGDHPGHPGGNAMAQPGGPQQAPPNQYNLGPKTAMNMRQAAFESPFLKQQLADVGIERMAAEQRTPLTMQAAKIDTGTQDQTRGMQMDYLSALQAAAAGKGPSVAQTQLQHATDQGIAAQQAMAASARGMSPAMAQRMAMHNEAGIQQDASLQSAQLRAQEQQAAMGQLGGALSGVRGQDQGLAFQQAGFDQGANQANLQGGIAQRAETDQLVQQYLGMGMNAQQAQFQALQDMEKTRFQGDIQKYGIDQGVAINGAAQTANTVGSVMSGVGTALGIGASLFSDERLKMDIEPGGEKASAFLDYLSAKLYRYRDKAHGDGPQLGVMAQDLEKSPVGSQMVINTPEGKRVDFGKGFGALVAATAELNRRLKTIEGAHA